MASVFRFAGSWRVLPTGGQAPSGVPQMDTPLVEDVSLARSATEEVVLSTDDTVALSFGGVASAAVVSIKAVGSQVRVRLTSAAGTAQSVPVDSYMLLVSTAAPITAIDLTRATGGVETTVTVFIGEAA